MTHDALTVVSPLCFGEEKNQDRAKWFSALQAGCVCDGVSSSPNADQAAEMIADLSPVLFMGKPEYEPLGVLAERLLASRIEARSRRPSVPPGTPPALAALLLQAAEKRLSSAYQTTLIAACFTACDEDVIVDHVGCGDSALFAFHDGQLLASYPFGEQEHSTAAVMDFAPGDELLVKVIGRASEQPDVQQAAGIKSQHAHNWLVCAALDLRKGVSASTRSATLRLGHDDTLLIPCYLIGQTHSPYCAVRYSGAIRQLNGRSRPRFKDKSNVTAVLPDHYRAGLWTRQRERYPADSQFILASDGFYSCFSRPETMWRWLARHREALVDSQRRIELMERLHAHLNERLGDDDMSFVWVFPKNRATEGSDVG